MGFFLRRPSSPFLSTLPLHAALPISSIFPISAHLWHRPLLALGVGGCRRLQIPDSTPPRKSGRAHASTPVAVPPRIPASARKKRAKKPPAEGGGFGLLWFSVPTTEQG